MNISILDSPKRYWVATILKSNFFEEEIKRKKGGMSDWSDDYKLYDTACYFCEYKNFECTPKNIQEYLLKHLNELDEYEHEIRLKLQKHILENTFLDVPIDRITIPDLLSSKIKIGGYFNGFKVVNIKNNPQSSGFKYMNGWTSREYDIQVDLLSEPKYEKFKTLDIRLNSIGISKTDVILPESTEKLFDMCYNIEKYFND
jgi:hypothetical protein